MLVVWILLWIVIAILVWLGFWLLITFLVGRSSRQRQFVAGKLPSAAPDRFYRGAAYMFGGRPIPWLGKSFEAANDVGFNIFTPRGAALLRLLTPLYTLFRHNADGNTDAYYFKTYASQGFRDREIDTLKLDYDSPENPFLIRIILDEIVETAPYEYLGKVHMKVFPGYYATIGFFGLRR